MEKTCAPADATGRRRPGCSTKLDGGIDHILLDEAQDTAPEQWTIVDALTEDFFAGAGSPARAQRRRAACSWSATAKQSIYSFQGARPELLAAASSISYRDRAATAGLPAWSGSTC